MRTNNSIQAGKGDCPRPVNGDKYRDNYEYIFRKKTYPEWVCNACGKEHGRRPEGNPYGATYHMDTCDICGEEKEVTQPRDFGHLREGWEL